VPRKTHEESGDESVDLVSVQLLDWQVHVCAPPLNICAGVSPAAQRQYNEMVEIAKRNEIVSR
jgi:hypothetical protein